MKKRRMSFLIVALAFVAVLVSGTYFSAQAACGLSLGCLSLCSPCSHQAKTADQDIMSPNDLEISNPRLDTAIGINPYEVGPGSTVR